eukprot:Platyproteum_vivax@DN13892_c0_g1_i1.p1
MTTAAASNELARVVKLFDATDGRDKFSCAIQYAARLMAYYTKGHPDVAERLTRLQENMADARKLFRLFKSANEVHKVREVLKKHDSDTFLTMLLSFSRMAFCCYWVFDNLGILCKVKFLKGNASVYGKRAAQFWVVGLLSGLLLEFYKLKLVVEKERKALPTTSPPRCAKFTPEMRTSVLGIVRTLGDLMPASNASGFGAHFGVVFSEPLACMGGLTSSMLTLQSLYPKA